MKKMPFLSTLWLGLLFASTLSAQSGPKVNTNRNGVAVSGYDVVAYFTDQKPLQGQEKFRATHGGATYWFASAEHLKTFQQAPQKYVPAYGGYCAYGVSKGYRVGIDPAAWAIVDGKLYLNYSMKVQKTWNEDRSGYIKKAEVNWAKLN